MTTPRSEAAKKAWQTRHKPSYKASQKEKASERALAEWCTEHNWKVLFFEGPTGAPRTGIVDAVMLKINSKDADALEIRLVQLKSGSSGLSGDETKRMKSAKDKATIELSAALLDDENRLHFVPIGS